MLDREIKGGIFVFNFFITFSLVVLLCIWANLDIRSCWGPYCIVSAIMLLISIAGGLYYGDNW